MSKGIWVFLWIAMASETSESSYLILESRLVLKTVNKPYCVEINSDKLTWLPTLLIMEYCFSGLYEIYDN